MAVTALVGVGLNGRLAFGGSDLPYNSDVSFFCYARNGLDILDKKGNNSKINPSCGKVDATNYALKTVSNFGNLASGYIEATFNYTLGNNLILFSSADIGTNNIYFYVYIGTTGKPSIAIKNFATVNVCATVAAISNGFHTAKFESTGSSYNIYVDGSLVSTTMVLGANDGKWLSFATGRDNIGIGINQTLNTPNTSTGTTNLIHLVDFNGTNKWYVTGVGKYIFDVIGGVHLNWSGTAHIAYNKDASAQLLNVGYSIYSKYTEPDEYVPYVSAGTPYNADSFLTGYTKTNVAGNTSAINMAPCVIDFDPLGTAPSGVALFNLSNATIWKSVATTWNGYDATKPYRVPIRVLFDTSIYYNWINTGYERKLFANATRNKAIPTTLNKVVAYSTNKTLVEALAVKKALKRQEKLSPLSTELASFISKYNTKLQDVTLVQIGDSISTDYGYSSFLGDPAYRPPFMTEANFNSKLEEKLRWSGQQYRRYNSRLFNGSPTNMFTDILGGGTMTEVTDDSVWGWVSLTDFYKAATRLITGGTNSGTSFVYPAAMKRCNFIYHSDSLFASSTLVTVAEGNGRVEVWNGSSWIEANGYTFSAQESAVVLNDPTYGNYYQDNSQKRLKMRSLTNLLAKTITITNVGTGRFGYWGVEYSPSEFMFTYIAASKGGHNIAMLKCFQPWMVDSFNPDLVLWQQPIINQACTVNPPTLNPTDFAAPFATHYDYLHTTKGYLVLPYVLFVGTQAGMVNTTTGDWVIGTLAGYGNIEIPNYIDALTSIYATRSAPFVNFFYQFLDFAQKKAIIENTDNIYTSAIAASSKTGQTFTVDGVHPNDYCSNMIFSLFEEYFNF
jgi:hypothetical protein